MSRNQNCACYADADRELAIAARVIAKMPDLSRRQRRWARWTACTMDRRVERGNSGPVPSMIRIRLYGNYGGPGYRRAGTEPIDILDAAYKVHDWQYARCSKST